MALSSSFVDQARELFAPFGEIRIKRMFGGAGVYCDEMFFALLDDDMVFLKVDETTRDEFVRFGLAPFSFESKDGTRTEMGGYHAAPGDIFDDEDALKRWTTLALDAASRAARRKRSVSRRAAKAGAAARTTLRR